MTRRIGEFFACEEFPVWAARSVPIGAGIPDLVIASYKPALACLGETNMSMAHILAYLHQVRCARLETITVRVNQSANAVTQNIGFLVDAGAVLPTGRTYQLSHSWREILPEIATVEVKVTDWQRGIRQACRNRIFAHRSFLALPRETARRIQDQHVFPGLGIGLLSVDDEHGVTVLRRARRHQPRVWSYYYQLALLVGTQFRRGA